jgi:AraC family transcriptional activator of pyochelin receptor
MSKTDTMEEKQQRIFEKGIVNSTVWQFNDIKMGHSVSQFKELMSHASSSQHNVVRLHFGLKGDYSFSYKQLNKTFDLIGGHHNMMYSEGFDMEVKNKTLELETFGIQFPTELFIKFTENATDHLKWFAENILNGKSVLLTEHWGSIDSSIQQVITQILHCTYAGDLKKLFLLSKSIELLVLSAESCSKSMQQKDTFIKSKSDKEKIIAARDLIMERMHSPPNLSEISRIVGLNEYKLKRGFKETFNNTIFGYLTDQRLNLAHQYLKDTEKTAAQVAAELGYATPQHFNNAFKKKFGTTPFLVRNNP